MIRATTSGMAEEAVRRLLKGVLAVLALAVAALPAVLVLTLGWHHAAVLGDPMGPGSGVLVLAVLFYVLWLPGTVLALIWVLDHVGLHFAVEERKLPVGKKTRRRQRAGLRLVAARERAREQAAREMARRRARREGAGTSAASGTAKGAEERPRTAPQNGEHR